MKPLVARTGAITVADAVEAAASAETALRAVVGGVVALGTRAGVQGVVMAAESGAVMAAEVAVGKEVVAAEATAVTAIAAAAGRRASRLRSFPGTL